MHLPSQSGPTQNLKCIIPAVDHADSPVNYLFIINYVGYVNYLIINYLFIIL